MPGAPAPLLESIAAWLDRTGTSPSRLGRAAARDPRLIFDLRRGRTAKPPMERRLRHYMRTHPDGG